jgi:hypothetical protein
VGKGDKNHVHCGPNDGGVDGELIVSRHHASHGNALVIGFAALLVAAIMVTQRRRVLIPR